MACGGCGSVRGMTKPEVANYIQELIDKHKLQGGLNDCEGNFLPQGAKVVLCDRLADLICDLIKTEKVCFPTVESLAYDADTETLTLTFGGKDYTTHIRVQGSTITGSGNQGVYTISQDGKEVVTIDTGVQDVKIEDGKLKVAKSGGKSAEFDLPKPVATTITDNNNGTGSIAYGDTTINVVTKPTVAKDNNDGTITVTNSDNSTVTFKKGECADIRVVNAFGDLELGFIHSQGCENVSGAYEDVVDLVPAVSEAPVATPTPVGNAPQ